MVLRFFRIALTVSFIRSLLVVAVYPHDEDPLMGTYKGV